MDEMNLGPFDRLIGLPGIESPEDIFGNVGGNFGGENPFGGGSISMGSTSESPYGMNPFAGDNFWNIFAGGVNPSQMNFGNNSNFSGGDTPFM
jgi:hypothetical protein